MIEWNDINENMNGVRYACKALEHLNKRAKSIKSFVNFDKVYKYEEMVMYINHVIWRYIIHKPDQYRLLDVRHNVMKNLILGDCDQLIKFILFGKNSNDEKKKSKENFQVKHIPRSMSWQKKHKYIRDDDINPFNRNKEIEDHEKIVPGNDLELAIYHCRDHEQKDTIVVAYLLEYYSSHAKDHVGWMVTVSKALHLLYKYNYDNYARRLFHKDCFANQNYFLAQDPYEIIPEEYLARRNNDAKFRAFRPNVDLQSSKEIAALYNYTNRIKNNIAGWFENFDNDHGKPPLALRVVPLPDFTVNKIKKKEADPFSRVVQYENCDDMFNNPAIEAVIDFRWKKAKNYIFIHFLRFLCFGLCFRYISLEYMSKKIDSEYLATSVVLFYFLAIHLLVTEAIQLRYRGFLLLKDPELAGIQTKDSTISGYGINDTTNDKLEINLRSDFNFTNRNDNPFSSFSTSIETAYFWINGDFIQRNLFDSWVVKVFTYMASIFIVIILQNVLIAFMGGVYEEAVTKGRQALLRYRANQIADYEALCHNHLCPHELDPKYIYYIGQSINFENWHKSRKEDQGAIYKDFEEPPTLITNAFKRSTYDEYSIWQFENNKNKNDKKGRLTEIIPATDVVRESRVEFGKSDDAERKDQVDVAKLIQEIENLKSNLRLIEGILN
ncbi:17997_t:CDS:2 [Funneliformis geosporum]|uniref:6734_t:CDS:1 n=1 Tax=Funneliformis geosporum TaxID=1117311 RepID=A0A9W4SGI2_9GLOM|nr:17997_t:CDS:2 [Funneliformis geosporum]CAI2168069.1 6734_t:CDS:2 [Funneliformis geosporum]